jgi:hypothetical protein
MEIMLEIRRPDRFESAAGITSLNCHRAWVRCENCGGLTNVRKDGKESELLAISQSYYAIDFPDTSLRERFNNIIQMPAGRSDNRQRVYRIKQYTADWFLNKTGVEKLRLLDIGAGLGVFLHAFLEGNSGWTAVALEPDPVAAKHLRSIASGRVKVVSKTLEKLGENQSSYNLCTLNKVLEHVSDPLSFLCKVMKMLDRGNGLLYVEVPDLLTIGNRKSTDNILGSLHHHLYGIRSLGILLNRAGLVPLLIERLHEPSGKLSVFAFAARPTAVKRFVNSKNRIL